MAYARLFAKNHAESQAHGGLLGPGNHEGAPRDGLKAVRDYVKVWTEPAVQGALDGVWCANGEPL